MEFIAEVTESSLSKLVELCTGKRSLPFLGSTMGRLHVVGRDYGVTSFLEGWISCADCSPGIMGCALWSTCTFLIKKPVEISLWLGMTIYAASFLAALFL